ncbi:MAG: hypothetical protein HYT94_03135 [Parcubacteria group bacterium]|nr:hypothetical protein [Parcubacteria group bacterium]
MSYEPNPKYIGDSEKSPERLRVAMRRYIERNPQGVDEIVQEMRDMGQSVTREEVLTDLGFDEESINRLLARI